MSSLKGFYQKMDQEHMQFVVNAAVASVAPDTVKKILVEKAKFQTIDQSQTVEELNAVLAGATAEAPVLVTYRGAMKIDSNPDVTLPKQGGYFHCEIPLGNVQGQATQLVAVDFSGSYPQSYDFTGATLDKVSFSGNRLDGKTIFTGASIHLGFFVGTKFDGVDLSTAKHIDDKTIFIASNWACVKELNGIKTPAELQNAITDGLFSDEELQLCRSHFAYALKNVNLESLQRDDVNAAIGIVDTALQQKQSGFGK